MLSHIFISSRRQDTKPDPSVNDIYGEDSQADRQAISKETWLFVASMAGKSNKERDLSSRMKTFVFHGKRIASFT